MADKNKHEVGETEDGEIIDSGDEEMGKSENTNVPDNQSKFGSYGGVVQRTDMGLANVDMYRTVAHHANSSSEDDYSDEEDSFLWKRKKMRYQAAMATNGGEQPFINPLLQRKNERQTSESDVSDTCQSPVKGNPPRMFGVETGTFDEPNAAVSNIKRKTNNIWGSVMTEQTLTHTMGGFDVNLPLNEKVNYEVEDRNVENYDFTLKEKDTRPDPVEYEENMGDAGSDNEEAVQDICDKEIFGKEDSKKQEERMKRKRKIKDRLGSRPNDLENDEERISVTERLGKKNVKDRLGEKIPVIIEKPEGYMDVTEEDSDEKVVNALVENLKEPKVKLMANVVAVLGKKRAIDLMHETEMINAQGGMMTNDNSRRRTPGGVFLQLLKFDCGLSSEELKTIFGEERSMYNKDRKKRAAVYKRKKKEEMKRRLGQVNFLDSIKEYQEVKEQVEEDETIEKILNNEEVTIKKKDSQEDKFTAGEAEMTNSIDEELGEVPDIEIGDM